MAKDRRPDDMMRITTPELADAFIEEQVKAGNVFLIRPKTKSDVGRIEKNKEKLIAFYEEGYQDAADCYEDLINYLGLEK